MADAWSTVVTREPEYDEHTRAQLTALQLWDAQCCPVCGNHGSLVPQGSTDRTARAPDGTRFEVLMYRCVACGIKDLASRLWREDHKEDQPTAEGALAADGLTFIVRTHTQEEPTEEEPT